MKQLYRNTAFYTLAFLATFLLVKTALLSSLDRSLQTGFYTSLHNSFITTILDFVTNFTLGTLVGVAAVILLLAYRKHFYGIVSLGISFVGLYIVVELFQLFVERPRPFAVNSTVTYLGSKLPDGFGFPSGHVAITFFLCTVLLYKFKEIRWIRYGAYVMTLLVAYSRLYLGAHYPLDVIGGALVGMIFGNIAILLDKKLPMNIKPFSSNVAH